MAQRGLKRSGASLLFFPRPPASLPAPHTRAVLELRGAEGAQLSGQWTPCDGPGPKGPTESGHL